MDDSPGPDRTVFGGSIDMSSTPRVLLLGDSIRMSYQPKVASLLEGSAEVVGPSDNCQFALYTLSSLARWTNELGNPDVVHWNDGIHDCGHNPRRSPVQMPLDIYVGNLRCILEALRAMTSRVVWATSTPVHPERPFRDTEWSWRNEEIDAYNAAATELMRSEGVPVNDLHAVVWSDVETFLSDDQLHLSEAGQTACAEAVVEAISSLL